MIISSNVSSIIAHGELNKTNNRVAESLARLSSGYKVNNSKDDSVAMAMSEKMRMQIRGLERASQNAADGISLVQTVEGTLNEANSMLQRMRELLVQGASDSYTDEDRVNISEEISSIKEEIDRISRDTEFNSRSVLNGDLERKVYPLDQTSGNLVHGIKVVYVDDSVLAGNYQVSIAADHSVSLTGFTGNAEVKINEEAGQDKAYVQIKDEGDFTMIFELDKSKVTGNQDIDFAVKDMGAMVIQMGSKEGQTIDVYIPEVSTRSLGLSYLKTETSDECAESIKIVDDAIEMIIKIRGKIGAMENRFSSSVDSLNIAEESMTSAISRLRDVDMAKEMTTFTQENVIQQAGISVLSQANQLPERILQLLQ